MTEIERITILTSEFRAKELKLLSWMEPLNIANLDFLRARPLMFRSNIASGMSGMINLARGEWGEYQAELNSSKPSNINMVGELADVLVFLSAASIVGEHTLASLDTREDWVGFTQLVKDQARGLHVNLVEVAVGVLTHKVGHNYPSSAFQISNFMDVSPWALRHRADTSVRALRRMRAVSPTGWLDSAVINSLQHLDSDGVYRSLFNYLTATGRDNLWQVAY